MNKDDAMKLALEALENSWTEPGNKQYEFEKEAITALREALAQQPAYRAVKTFHEGKPVYVAEQPAQPAQPSQSRSDVKPWVGLTDEELVEFSSAELGPYDLCLEVEAKLKEKNT